MSSASVAPTLPLLSQTQAITLETGRRESSEIRWHDERQPEGVSEQDLGVLISLSTECHQITSMHARHMSDTPEHEARPTMHKASTRLGSPVAKPSLDREQQRKIQFGPNPAKSPQEDSRPLGYMASARVKFENAKHMHALMDKYDPGMHIEAGKMWPMDEHRKFLRRMFLDNILVAASRLQKHGWILGSDNEHYRPCKLSSCVMPEFC